MLRGLRMFVWGLGILSALYVVWGALALPARGTWGVRLRNERVMSVAPGSVAQRAGVRVGDLVRELPPAVRGTSEVVTFRRGDVPFKVPLVAVAPDEVENARTGLALLLAAAFLLVSGVVLFLRSDRIVYAFALFAFSTAFALAPQPVVPSWLVKGTIGSLFGLARLGASLLLPAALVDFFARFPEGRPGRTRWRLAVFCYTFAAFLFVYALVARMASESGPDQVPLARLIPPGSFDGLAALFFSLSIAAALFAFLASHRAAPPHHRPRLTVLLWSMLLGFAPVAVLTFAKNLAPEIEWPGERWIPLSLLLVPLGFGYAIAVHRVFDLGAVGAYGRGLARLAQSPPPGVAHGVAPVDLPEISPGGRERGAETSPVPLENGAGFGFRPAPFAPLAAVLDAAAQELTQSLGLEHCAVFNVSGGGAALTSMHGQPPGFNVGPILERLPQPIVEALARVRAPLAIEEFLAGENGGESARALAPLADLGTSLLVPLFSGDSCRAVLALGPRLSGPWFDPDEREHVAAFARQASVAVENADLHDRLLERAALERDVHLARRIQDRLLPRSAPLLPTVDLAGLTVPAGEIGGDYYDFLALGPRAIGIAVADVCGKGLPAALLLAGVQAGLRSRAADDLSPSRLLARLNDELVAIDQPEKFVCLAYARLDARRRTLAWANAGLNPAIVVRADGEVQEVRHGGLILGVSPAQEYQEVEWTFERGSLVAFYTDGVTDSLNGDTPFGVERLADALVRHREKRASRIAEKALAESAAWHRDGPPDDRTITIVKFL